MNWIATSFHHVMTSAGADAAGPKMLSWQVISLRQNNCDTGCVDTEDALLRILAHAAATARCVPISFCISASLCPSVCLSLTLSISCQATSQCSAYARHDVTSHLLMTWRSGNVKSVRLCVNVFDKCWSHSHVGLVYRQLNVSPATSRSHWNPHSTFVDKISLGLLFWPIMFSRPKLTHMPTSTRRKNTFYCFNKYPTTTL